MAVGAQQALAMSLMIPRLGLWDWPKSPPACKRGEREDERGPCPVTSQYLLRDRRCLSALQPLSLCPHESNQNSRLNIDLEVRNHKASSSEEPPRLTSFTYALKWEWSRTPAID
ncbi:hypothetical protein D9619_011086 [Psilocybe cf. subviscida]|uniref:Uncharacterized protein n=1 Tax=Psilocybe cf. subviscida TaxID=2480587 RepID=A0A8H5BJH2_9AGAR|nr:hypothetical protein D9619_011086 [Psilocybe cf. subviscida]